AFARGQQRVERAAHLVRAGALQVLELEPGAEALGVMGGRDVQVLAQPRLRRQHVAGGHVDGAGYGRVHQTVVSQWRYAASWPRTTRPYSACSSRVTGLSPYTRSSICATGATSAAVPQANTSSASSSSDSGTMRDPAPLSCSSVSRVMPGSASRCSTAVMRPSLTMNTLAPVHSTTLFSRSVNSASSKPRALASRLARIELT